MKKRVALVLTIVPALLAWATLILWAPAVFAQDANRPLLLISEVDATQFPTVTLFVYGENLGEEIATIPLEITEETIPQPALADRFADVGIQVAFLLDSSSSILNPGNSGVPRHQEAASAVRQLVTVRQVLSAELDWLAAYIIGSGPTAYQELITWSQDHNAVVNALSQYQPDGAVVNTSLFGFLQFGLDQFEDTPVPPSRQKFLVAFSDGVDVVSALDLENITNRAERIGVRIHTVLLGRGTREARDNMERIATLTGGQFVTLNTIADLDGLWDRLIQARGQRLLTYRTTRAQASEVAVTATLSNSRQLVRTSPFPTIGALPVEIQVLQPLDNEPLVRTAAAADTPLELYEPSMLEVALHFTWPDGHPRQLRRVEYEFNNQFVLNETEPFDRATFPIAMLGEGVYRLQIKAVDELGLTTEARPIVIPVQLLQPTPLPTEPPTPTDVPTAPPTPTVESATPTIASATPTNTTVITEPARVANEPPPVPAPEVPTPMSIDGLGIWSAGLIRTYSGLEVQPRIALAFLAVPILLLLGGGLLLLTRRRQPRPGDFDLLGAPPIYEESGYTEPQRTVELDDVTEPAIVPYNIAPAYLVYQAGGDHLPKKLPIEAGREVRIGRRREFCDLVIDDKRVSRLHAVIAEKNDGFHIRDEGSAGGTFVNRRQLGVSADWHLKHGDLINFNTIEYRFELADQEPPPPSSGGGPTSPKDATELYIRR